MGVDWTALEDAIRKSALRQAREVITGHPDHVFYAVALDGVSTEPSDRIDLPVLALNSEQALARDLALAAVDQGPVVHDDGGPASFADTELPADGPDSALDGSDLPDDEDSEDFDPDFDAEFEDEFDEDLDVDADFETGGFYSARWNAPDWHWCSMELFDESACELWSQALTAVAEKHGWEPTMRRYYQMLVSVAQDLGRELATGRNADLIAYVSDEDHAEVLLRRCLTPGQLAKHFPDLAAVEAPASAGTDPAGAEPAQETVQR